VLSPERLSPERAKFCLECGPVLAERPPASALEERKFVSVLFCRLVRQSPRFGF
jgi:hypothetical protein